MEIRVIFDHKALLSLNLDYSSVSNCLSEEFGKFNLVTDVTIERVRIRDRGKKDDFAHMWIVITRLMKSKWFRECASSCVFFDDDGTYEDVLAQAWKYDELMT